MEPISLVVFLNKIEDKRKPQGKRHQQLANLIIMIMAMLCGKNSLKNIARFARAHQTELAKFIPLPNGKAPSYSTFQRLSQYLDANEVCNSFNNWMAQYIQPESIAADGKSITSTVTNATNSNQCFASLVSFFGHKSQLIYQIGFLENNKCSEIQVVQELISKLQITKAIFTLDALHCQKKTVQVINDSGNGYVITVKKNQPKLHKSIAEKTETKPIDSYSWKQEGHGHDSQCRIKIWEADEDMQKQWAGLNRYISVQRSGIRDGKEFNTTTYYISSENKSAWSFSQIIRGHRKIENTLHWTKDVVQNEDNCGLVKPQAAVNMAVIRDISFNLLVMNGFKSISDGISAVGESVVSLWDMMFPSKKNSI